ncbi:leucyl/phenylalanyl-tRNA--protein transferase [Azoarcus sp. KH32C]|uniref:leucyl/phenylalanyl-tRNA--protein transferase n=1 Tax=Azoarcus sp. KH32C TaxID=748247 RepID=UPI00023863BE|nr:leucyl/phenylalanyl-tRNA--protein transferase [Azoarcus sp. KH32C]BAL24119.1 leucyl/phenylalanyl-tRNA--protein transferase [Azoarcus sp. KH32C]
MIPWLSETPEFPAVSQALAEPNGLLAAGGALTPDWLLAAYRRGIFPWFCPGEPILWWSPDPRLVLLPSQMHISRSLRRTLRQGRFEVRFDTAFAQVIGACAEPREPGGGTWITSEMQRAYVTMHELGYAHSVESWDGDQLVGGLYGVALGGVFYGESMFSRRSDASKVALAHLARYLDLLGFAVIDCQMTTSHLLSLGAREIARSEFVSGLAVWARKGMAPSRWPASDGRIVF